MDRKTLRCGFIFLMAALGEPALGAGQNPDATEIQKVGLGLEAAWNHHDMKAWANLFTEDADFVNVAGWWWKGRAEIEKKHMETHAYIFRDSTLAFGKVATRFLTPEIAIVHVLWSLTGTRNPDGTDGQPRKGILTEVLQKQNGKWLIASAENADSRPEAPMPAGPPKK